MKLQPSKTHILCRFYNPLIKPASNDFDADASRTRVEVLEVGPDVTVCKKGDFLLLIPKPNVLSVAGDDGLIDQGHVLGIVLDDTAPLAIEA